MSGFDFAPPDTEFYDLAMYVANERPVDYERVAAKFEEWSSLIGDPIEYGEDD